MSNNTPNISIEHHSTLSKAFARYKQIGGQYTEAFEQAINRCIPQANMPQPKGNPLQPFAGEGEITKIKITDRIAYKIKVTITNPGGGSLTTHNVGSESVHGGKVKMVQFRKDVLTKKLKVKLAQFSFNPKEGFDSIKKALPDWLTIGKIRVEFLNLEYTRLDGLDFSPLKASISLEGNFIAENVKYSIRGVLEIKFSFPQYWKEATTKAYNKGKELLEEGKKFAKEIGERLYAAMSKAKKYAQLKALDFKTALSKYAKLLKEKGIDTATKFTKWASEQWKKAVTIAKALLEKAKSLYGKFWQKTKEFASFAAKFTGKVFSKVWQTLNSELVKTILKNIGKGLSKFLGLLGIALVARDVLSFGTLLHNAFAGTATITFLGQGGTGGHPKANKTDKKSPTGKGVILFSKAAKTLLSKLGGDLGAKASPQQREQINTLLPQNTSNDLLEFISKCITSTPSNIEIFLKELQKVLAFTSKFSAKSRKLLLSTQYLQDPILHFTDSQINRINSSLENISLDELSPQFGKTNTTIKAILISLEKISKNKTSNSTDGGDKTQDLLKGKTYSECAGPSCKPILDTDKVLLKGATPLDTKTHFTAKALRQWINSGKKEATIPCQIHILKKDAPILKAQARVRNPTKKENAFAFEYTFDHDFKSKDEKWLVDFEQGKWYKFEW